MKSPSETRAVYLESGTELDNLHDGNRSRQAFFQVQLYFYGAPRGKNRSPLDLSHPTETEKFRKDRSSLLDKTLNSSDKCVTLNFVNSFWRVPETL
jgi:hypothetical protein